MNLQLDRLEMPKPIGAVLYGGGLKDETR